MTHLASADPAAAALEAAAMAGCAESRLLVSRRSVLGITAGLFSSAFMPRLASAATADPRLLIVVIRGGMDGVNVVVPHGDPAYASMRGAIALSRSDTLSLDSFYGLNTALTAFGTMYRQGEAAAVHATCVPLQNRSHFDAQDNLENGMPGLSSNATGWLNRLLAAMPAGAPIRAQGAIQIGDAPLLLRGPAPVLGWSPTWFSHAPAQTTNQLLSLYASRDPQLGQALQAGLKADALAERTSSGSEDGISNLRKGFRAAGRLLSAADGPRIAVLSVGNFDTHSNQGTTSGFLWGSLRELDNAIADFQANARTIWPNTAIVMATEFGRTVRVNGDRGTDHGVGTVALLAGGAVAGGRVYGDWPGVAAKDLVDDSDLKATTDLRAVFKGVLRDHVGVPTRTLDEVIFPESAAVLPMGGLLKGAGVSGAFAASSGGYGAAAGRPPAAIARYRAANPA